MRLVKAAASLLVLASRLLAGDCPTNILSEKETLAKFQELDRAAQAALDRGRYSEAVQHYRDATCVAPGSARAFYGLGTAEAASGNFAAAHTAFERAYEILPSSPMPLAMLVRVGVAMKDLDQVKGVLRKAGERFPSDSDLHSGLARFLAENQLLDLALAEYLRFEQTGSKDAETLVALAAIENSAGAQEDAIRHTAAVESNAAAAAPLRASAAGIAGLSYESLGRRDEAIEHLRHAIELAPAQENSYLALAFIYEKAQNFKDAVAVLEQGRKQVPASPNFLLPLGNNLVWAGENEAGIRVLNELIQKSPATAEGYVRLAEAYRATGQPSEEAASLLKLARVNPDYPMVHVLAAQAMMNADPVDYQAVLRELAQAEAKSPADADVFYLRGKVYVAQQRYDEAIRAFQRAIELRPMDSGPYYQLGLVYRKLGRAELAKQAFDRVQVLNEATPRK